MTSNYHTPIPEGAAANAASFNDPLSEMDEVLTELLITEHDGHIIQNEGVDLVQRPRLDFVGAGVSATDDGSGKTTVTIPGGAAGWGDLTGTLSDQADLQAALNAKENTANKVVTMSGNSASDIVFLTAKAIYDWATGLFSQIGHTHSYQESDADLTAIAGLSPADDDIIQRKSGSWVNRTLSQLATDLTEFIQDIVGAMVSGNSETNITVTYDDTNGKLDFNVTGGGGGGTLPRLTKTADYTITSSDINNLIVLTSATVADKTFTLPAASALADGEGFWIKNESDYTLSWARAGSDTVDGATSGKLPKNWALYIVSNGSNAFTVVSKYKPPIVVTVNKTSNQSVSNATEAFISWDTALIANTAMWASSPNPTRLTVPPGATKVRLVMQCAWDSGYAVGLRLIYAYKNGAGFDGVPIFTTPATTTSSFYSMTVSGVLPVNPGDYFEIVGYQTSEATINIVGGAATFAMLEVVD